MTATPSLVNLSGATSVTPKPGESSFSRELQRRDAETAATGRGSYTTKIENRHSSPTRMAKGFLSPQNQTSNSHVNTIQGSRSILQRVNGFSTPKTQETVPQKSEFSRYNDYGSTSCTQERVVNKTQSQLSAYKLNNSLSGSQPQATTERAKATTSQPKLRVTAPVGSLQRAAQTQSTRTRTMLAKKRVKRSDRPYREESESSIKTGLSNINTHLPSISTVTDQKANRTFGVDGRLSPSLTALESTNLFSARSEYEEHRGYLIKPIGDSQSLLL